MNSSAISYRHSEKEKMTFIEKGMSWEGAKFHSICKDRGWGRADGKEEITTFPLSRN